MVVEKMELNKLPINPEAEAAVLGSIIRSPERLKDVIEIVKISDFHLPKNQLIYSQMLNIFNDNKEVDILILAEYLKKSGQYEEAGGKEYLLSLFESVPLADNIVNYANIVNRKAFFRNLIIFFDNASEKCYKEDDGISDYLLEELYQILSQSEPNAVHQLSDLLYKNYSSLANMVGSKQKFKGISTGFFKLDEMLSGLIAGNLYFVAGRPAMGKTSFAINIAQSVAIKSKKNVLIFSLEMSKEELTNRITSSEALISSEHIRKGSITESDLDCFLEILTPLSSASIFIDDSADLSVLQLKSKAKKLKIEKNIDLIVIDYLQLMSGMKSDNRLNEITNITRNLKILAKELNIPVVCISQLSRECDKRSDSRPILSDLRDSGSIEQDADVVIFIYRDEYYKPNLDENKNLCEVIVAKHRNGKTGTVTVGFAGDYTSFYNL